MLQYPKCAKGRGKREKHERSVAARSRWSVHGHLDQIQQIETLASELRKRAGIGPSEVVDAFEFAIRLIGENSIVVLDRLAVGARLRHADEGYRIELRDGLPDINFACSHEVAHWALREIWGYNGDDEERLANQLGAALLMPRLLVVEVVDRYGSGLGAVRPLARVVEVSKTAAQLRLAEVIGDERAVVTRSGNLIVRNAERIDWTDPLIRQLGRRDAAHPSLAKTVFKGGIDHGRVALTLRRA